MAKIEIEWLHDARDCETCGGGYAQGAVVFVDDIEAIRLEPQAACYDGVSYEDDEVYRRIFAHLGHELVIVT